jgi:hypothetical protein
MTNGIEAHPTQNDSEHTTPSTSTTPSENTPTDQQTTAIDTVALSSTSQQHVHHHGVFTSPFPANMLFNSSVHVYAQQFLNPSSSSSSSSSPSETLPKPFRPVHASLSSSGDIDPSKTGPSESDHDSVTEKESKKDVVEDASGTHVTTISTPATPATPATTTTTILSPIAATNAAIMQLQLGVADLVNARQQVFENQELHQQQVDYGRVEELSSGSIDGGGDAGNGVVNDDTMNEEPPPAYYE